MTQGEFLLETKYNSCGYREFVVGLGRSNAECWFGERDFFHVV